MRTRVYVYASLALLAAVPARVLANVTVNTTAVQAPPGDVAAGATVGVQCTAEGNRPSGSFSLTTTIDRIDVTVSGGTVDPGQLTGAVSQTCSSTTFGTTCSWLQGTVSWTTPATPGTLTATCTVSYTNTNSFGGTTPGTVSSFASITTVQGSLPPVVSAISGPSQVLFGSASTFAVTASDPNDPAQALTYAWTATGGTITPDASDPASASWQAPEQPGLYEVAVTVTAGSASALAKKSVNVLLAAYQAGLPVAVRAPQRLATDDAGVLYLVDGQQGELGQVAMLTVRGEARGFATLPEPALAVTYGAGYLWVTTAKGSLYKLDARSGRLAGKVALEGGRLYRPLGIAYDAANATLWIADAASNVVRLVRPDGTAVATIRSAGGAPILEPVDVAVDAAGGRAFVLVGNAKTDSLLAVGEPIAAARFLHAFDLAGGYVGSYVPRGGAAGQLSRASGVAVTASKVFLSDIFQGTVQVVSPTGAAVASIGEFGTITGQLTNPSGLAVMANGDLVVANTSLSRVDRFGTGAALPTCAGDSDCDGLPDDWEIAHAMNPNWAGDSLLDYDGDGLSNTEEYALGTDPRNRDTDGDGFSDGDEVLAHRDPLDPNDHRPIVAGSGPMDVPPGFVKMLATVSAPAGCTPALRWAQAGGPAVALSGPATTNPSFIARAAGAYDFDAIAECGTQTSVPARVRVTVRNVPPFADAGRVVVAAPGSPIRLDALFSSDANGDALSYGWDQTLGRAVTGAESGTALALRPRGPGLYKFMLTTQDAKGAAATAEVPVLVAAGPVATAIAAAFPSEIEVGQTVSLDGTASLVTEDAPAFVWEQLSGPVAVTLTGADQPVATFAATAAGRYTFAVTVVGSDGQRSPPGRTEVFVAEAGTALPTVQAASAATSIVAVNTAAALDASGTGSGFAWTQVAGPAAGLTYADTATAMAVPFSPGFYVFEVTATQGSAVSRPMRVAFEARAGNQAIPVARATVPGLAPVVEQLVFLDGRQSTGASRFRWTQIEGAWVVLSGQTPVATFRAPAPGKYVFELEVDDGSVRSAPARVELDVSEQGVE